MSTTLLPPPTHPAPPAAAGSAEPTDLADARRPRWARPGLAALLVATAIAYTVNLSASGDANSFYAAAVEAATRSWKAFFFGSLDSSNFITVDKPPASLWLMDLSARIFGFSSWSLLVPEALLGVAAVALLYATVRRWFGAGAGLAAGALLAATPVAALMFRFDNPDAFLTCCLVASAYTLTRALDAGRWRWVLATGGLVGMAFLGKMLQAFTVVPAFALVYLVAAPVGLRRRVGQVLGAGAAVTVAAGWWVAIVALLPAADRPFVDGSPDNSILNLIFVYNGFGRLSGSGGGAAFSGSPGILRLFNDVMGGQASWLLPAALVALVAGLVARGRAPRTDRVRAALLLWGGWLIVTAAVFSFGKGIIHTYYTVALAPAIAALVAIGGRQLWTQRHRRGARLLAAAAVAVTGWWSWTLLERTPAWLPWLRWVVAVASVGAVVGLVALAAARTLGRTVAAAAVALAITAGVAGPVAYAANAINTGHTGSTPSAGPATGGGFGGGGHGGGFGGGGQGAGARTFRGTGTPPGGARSGGRTGGPTGNATGNATGGPTGGPTTGGAKGGAPEGSAGTARGFAGGSGGAGGGGGGGTATSAALTKALEADADHYRWVAATFGSQSAASLELATGGDPVMAIGGFDGQGGELTLAAFERYVSAGDIHYFIASGTGGPGGSSNSESAITSWVEAHFTAKTVGGTTVYDLTQTER